MPNPGDLGEARAGAAAQLSVGGAVGPHGCTCGKSCAQTPGHTQIGVPQLQARPYTKCCSRRELSFSDEDYKGPERLSHRPKVKTVVRGPHMPPMRSQTLPSCHPPHPHSLQKAAVTLWSLMGTRRPPLPPPWLDIPMKLNPPALKSELSPRLGWLQAALFLSAPSAGPHPQPQPHPHPQSSVLVAQRGKDLHSKTQPLF